MATKLPIHNIHKRRKKYTVGCTILTLINSSEVSTNLPNYKSQNYINIFKKLCIRRRISLSFCIILCNVSKYWFLHVYLYGKQMKSQVGNKSYLSMILLFVHLNRLCLHECRTMILKCHKDSFFMTNNIKI